MVATNRPLAGLVADGRFRMDLYYRLIGVEVQVPPLRERRGDVVELAHYFLERHRGLRTLQLSEAAVDALLAYHWPGNVRELENCIERACILANGTEITSAELNITPPADYTSREQAALLDGFDLRGSLSEVSGRAQRLVERRKISATLKECDYNKSRAAERLGVSYKTLLTRIKELELE